MIYWSALIKRVCLAAAVMIAPGTAQAQSCDHVDGSAEDMVRYIWTVYDKDKKDPKVWAQSLLLWNAHEVDGLDEHSVARIASKGCFRDANKCGMIWKDRAVPAEFAAHSALGTVNLNRSIIPEKPPAEMLQWAKKTIGGCALSAGGETMTDTVVETRPLAQCARWVQAIKYNGRNMDNSAFRGFISRWENETTTIARRHICNSASDYVATWANREVQYMNTGLQRLEQQRREAAAARARQQAAEASTPPTGPHKATVDEIFDSWFKTHQRWVDCERKHGSCTYSK